MKKRDKAACDASRLLDVQRVLDEHYREILELVEDESKALAGDLNQREPLAEQVITLRMRSIVKTVYRSMAVALYRVLITLQKELCDGERVNLYFWPGYRARNIPGDSRLYYVDNEDVLTADPLRLEIRIYRGVGIAAVIHVFRSSILKAIESVRIPLMRWPVVERASPKGSRVVATAPGSAAEAANSCGRSRPPASIAGRR